MAKAREYVMLSLLASLVFCILLIFLMKMLASENACIASFPLLIACFISNAMMILILSMMMLLFDPVMSLALRMLVLLFSL